MADIKAEDILYGRNGQIYLGEGTGKGEMLATANNIEARVRVQSTEIMLPRQFTTRHRRIGWSGEGTLRIYRHNNLFFKTMKDMINPKVSVPSLRLVMNLINSDPDGEEYDESIVLMQVKFWDFDWMFNMTDFVELPMRFTFEEIDTDQDDEAL